jgi:probable rRNA maturation factor
VKIKKRIKRILSALGLNNDSELSVMFVNDSEIRDINRKYLNRDYPTDVISFSMQEGEEFPTLDTNMLGDVVISLDNAKQYAEKKGVHFEDEVTYLLIHGILHLAGYDHEKEGSDHVGMKRKEEELYDLIIKNEKE